MPLTFETFHRLASSAWLGTRDIVVSEAKGRARLGNLFFSSGAKINDATMKAFRTAISQKHGAFGEHAFDMVLSGRQQLRKSLRACDVKAVLSKLETVRTKRFIGRSTASSTPIRSCWSFPKPCRARCAASLPGLRWAGVA